jgi:hypothetical protein
MAAAPPQVPLYKLLTSVPPPPFMEGDRGRIGLVGLSPNKFPVVARRKVVLSCPQAAQDWWQPIHQ